MNQWTYVQDLFVCFRWCGLSQNFDGHWDLHVFSLWHPQTLYGHRFVITRASITPESSSEREFICINVCNYKGQQPHSALNHFVFHTCEGPKSSGGKKYIHSSTALKYSFEVLLLPIYAPLHCALQVSDHCILHTKWLWYIWLTIKYDELLSNYPAVNKIVKIGSTYTS